MAFIIPDTILEKLTCHVCQKYLSVKPVKVYQSKEIKCGRCSQDDDEGVLSIYGAVAENGLFRCVNRYEGCEKLLTYCNARSHEDTCLSRNYDCPVCPQRLQFSGFLLLNHFKREHAKNVLEVPEFVISLFSSCDIEKWYLYNPSDSIFIIHVRYNASDEILWLKCFCVGPAGKVKFINHSFSIRSEDKELMTTLSKPCSRLGSNDVLGFSIELGALLNNGLVTITLNVDLYNTGSFIELPVTLANFVHMSVQTETNTSLQDLIQNLIGTLFLPSTQLVIDKLMRLILVVALALGLFLGVVWSLIYFTQIYFLPAPEPPPKPEPKGIEVFLEWYSDLLHANKSDSQKFAKDGFLILVIKIIFGGCLYVIYDFLNYLLDIVNSTSEFIFL